MLLLIIRKKAYMLPPLAVPRGKLSPVCVPVKAPVCMSIFSHHPLWPPTGEPVTPEQASCWLLSTDLQKCDPAFTARLRCPSPIKSVAPSFGPGDTCLSGWDASYVWSLSQDHRVLSGGPGPGSG